MGELAERARELAIDWGMATCTHPYPEMCGKCQSAVDAVEQALLAERRLAMEEAAKIAANVRENRRMEYDGREIATTYNDGLMFGTEVIEQALRAAAEKEVSNG